ncbi:hypothetical protein [Methylophaga sulfidovorans]|uniref:Uncharacterized protein n=1 Tax=Methylophaga sulfidovorans TaxID=45496 RepID=A0A1I3XDQ0_9GAMM|nr:hypothetical protein [Methylophaga sulfidovorans]SFK17647.1 hypothetical protein SAMN04488079_10617 [Methylophaga sulfidovorans]
MDIKIKRIIITGLVGLLVLLAYRLIAFEYMSYSIQNMSKQMLENAQQAQNKIVEQQLQLQRQKKQEAAAKAIAEQRAQERAFKIQQEKARYEQAFEDWYKQPEGCDNWRSQSHMVECVNHKMRAKNEFKAIYNKPKK